MIRLIFAVILTVGALIGLTLRLQRDGALPEPAERLRAEVRTLDLGEAVSSTLEKVAQASAAPAPAPVVSEPQEPELRAVEPEPVDDVETIVEEVIPPRSAPFVESPLPEAENSGTGGNHEPAPDEQPRPTVVASSVDQDAWADLIRRMLGVYRRTSEPR